jgi:uncharacterized membrane protein
MAGLAYILLPVSGAIAYFNARSPRIRFHGLQAIALGLVWPAALYGASAVSVRASQLVWAIGAIAWMALMLPAAFGKDLKIPVVGKLLQRAAVQSPKAVR